MTEPMTLEDLKAMDSRYRLEKPKLFEIAQADPPATQHDLDSVENSIGVKLPDSYRRYLSVYGGGVFGFTVIFSAYTDGEWFLPNRQRDAATHLPHGLLAFSDDFAGGYYVFKIADGSADDRPWYWNADGGLVHTNFANIYEFVARYAYEPA